MDNYFTKKEQIVILVLALLIVSALGLKLLNKTKEKVDLTKEETAEPLVVHREPVETIVEKPKGIMIHISGEVYNPGIISLESGQRLIDAVEIAGGLKKEADLDKINLAKKLQDEDKIYIPKIGEDIEIQHQTIISTGTSSSTPGKIDINSCTKEDLMTLPGIGDLTANKILDYRTQNAFKKIEDIMDVSGIGEKKFSSIKELIIVK